MSPLEGLTYGFSIVFTPSNLIAVMMGAVLGTMVGVLPGIGPTGAIAILLTTTLTLKPETALIMLAGIFYGSMYGGSTTSILVNVPGEAASVVTCIDGYQMAKKGRAGAALAVAAVGSFAAGSIGIVGLQLFAPPLARAALSFGSPEYCTLALLGIFALSRLSGGSVWKGILVVSLGLMIATVGMDTISGMARYTFDIVALMQGIEMVPVIMGLFGVAEVLQVAERAGGLPQITQVRFREMFPNWGEWRLAIPAILRGTAVGFLIGLVPGPGGIISTFASYNVERRISKHPEEFGRGAIEGVAGPESANNAASSALLIPLLALGIPFGPTIALLLAAMMIQGVQPGPMLMEQHPEIFWGVVASMYLGNVALLVLNFPLVGLWVSVLRIPQAILLALILAFTLVGAYSINNSMLDLMVLIVMGIIGYLLKKLDFDAAPMILALILGPMLEKNFRQSLFMSRGDPMIFLQRPISLAFLIALVLILAGPGLWQIVRRRRSAK